MPEYCQRLGMPATANEFVSELQRQLAEFAKRVDEQFPQNTTVKMGSDGLPVLLKYSARVIPESAQRLHIEVMRRMPQRSLLDILVNVERLTNFTNHFGPASDTEPKIERAAERYLLTVFAIGSSLGPVQAARHHGALSKPLSRQAGIEMIAKACPDQPPATWDLLRSVLDEGIDSIDRRLEESGPLQPDRFILKEVNERLNELKHSGRYRL